MWLIPLRPDTTSWVHKLEALLTFPASCVICMGHRQALKQLSVICTLPLSDLTHFLHPQFWTSQHLNSPIPPFTTLLQKVTRSHRRCARLLCGCHDNHGGLHTGLMYRMAVMDWTLGAVRRNYTFRTLSIFFLFLSSGMVGWTGRVSTKCRLFSATQKPTSLPVRQDNIRIGQLSGFHGCKATARGWNVLGNMQGKAGNNSFQLSIEAALCSNESEQLVMRM